jgi:DNA mismatch endonuclease (patch repair protein)
MRRIRSVGMKPEMVVRSMVHRMGYRFRLHVSSLPGKPDLVFPSCGKIIFVNGCFWHAHDDIRCPIARTPRSNKKYWSAKLETNVARDKRNVRRLRALGWRVLTVWECWIRNPEALERRIERFLSRCYD